MSSKTNYLQYDQFELTMAKLNVILELGLVSI